MAANTPVTVLKRSFHSIKSEHAENSIQKGLASGVLTEEDAELIHEFIAELQASKNISLARTNNLFLLSSDGGGSSHRLKKSLLEVCMRA